MNTLQIKTSILIDEEKFFERKTNVWSRILIWVGFSLLVFGSQPIFSQGVGISEASINADPSSILELRSSLRGFLAPRMTTLLRNGIVTPAQGLLVYDTNLNSFWYYDGSEWKAVGFISLTGESYLSLTGQVLTANPINLSGTNATGILAAERFPALTGDITNTAGSVATTISPNSVTYAKIQSVSATGRLLGSSSATTTVQEISLGSGLNLTGTTLSASGLGGTVTTVSVVSANGFAGTVANNSTTPAITLTTSINGILKGDGTAISAASAGTDFVAPNLGITGDTKTKITYDIKGLVIEGADATTADIAPSADRRYVTDAQQTVIANTSGTNTGDNSANTASNSYADAKVGDAIADGVTTVAPAQNAVFDALALKTDANTAVVSDTKTKITYDIKGLVIEGADATTADIAPSADRNYVTDAQQTVIANTSGANTGDNSANTTSNSYADAKVGDAIADGTTTVAPSQNAVFDALALKTDANTAVVSDTKTKITYDIKGLVIEGADATTADIAPSADRRYVTDAQQTIIENTSGANTGDVTLAVIGSTPNANGGSLTSQVLTLQPADASFGGVMTTTTQTIAGAKTWNDLGTFNSGLTSAGADVNLNHNSNFATNINTGTSSAAVNIGSSSSTLKIGSSTTISAAFNFGVDAAGGGNAYSISLSPAPTAYVPGMIIIFKAGDSNIGACTIDVNGLGSINILKDQDGGTLQNLANDDIDKDGVYILVYDGTQFVLIK